MSEPEFQCPLCGSTLPIHKPDCSKWNSLPFPRFAFPLIRHDFSPKPKPEIMDSLEEGHDIEGTRCMRDEECGMPRWQHPKLGALVLCKEHAAEVGRGERRAPPIRRGIDYQTTYSSGALFYLDYVESQKK